MRQTLVLTCLLLTAAWSHPAGPLTKPKPPVETTGVSVVDKTDTDVAAAELKPVVPPETTDEIMAFDEAVVPLPVAESQRFLSGDALASLDAIADEYGLAPPSRIPIPPHRAVPHEQVCEALADAAVNNDLPTPFFIRLIWQESGFKQNIISPAGAVGVAQFMPETAARRGLDDPFNPLQAVRASAHLLRDLAHKFGNLGLAAAAYNAGPQRVQDWLDKKGSLPQETRDYVERITGKKADQWKTKAATAAPLRVPALAPCQHEAGLYASNGPEQIPLPPVQQKAEPVTVVAAKTAPAATKTASAKSAAKTASAKSVTKTAKADKTIGPPLQLASADDSVAVQAEPIAKAETKPDGKTKKPAVHNAAKPVAKAHGKKVKVADAAGSR